MIRLSIVYFVLTYKLLAGLAVNLGYHRVRLAPLRLPKW